MYVKRSSSFWTIVLFLLGTIGFCFSCKKSHHHINPDSLIGSWQEIELRGSKSPTTYFIKFENSGKFQMTITQNFSGLDTGVVCIAHPKAYIKGNFSAKHRTINFEGNYYDSTYHAITPNCKNQTIYNEKFISVLAGNTLTLNANAADETDKIHLYKQ